MMVTLLLPLLETPGHLSGAFTVRSWGDSWSYSPPRQLRLTLVRTQTLVVRGAIEMVLLCVTLGAGVRCDSLDSAVFPNLWGGGVLCNLSSLMGPRKVIPFPFVSLSLY